MVSYGRGRLEDGINGENGGRPAVAAAFGNNRSLIFETIQSGRQECFSFGIGTPTHMELDAYLEALASARPTPGGGSAATVVAAMGAALIGMVARITGANPKYAPVVAEAAALVEESDGLRSRLLAARIRDEAAYGGVVAAQQLPRHDDTQRALRTAAIQQSLADAAAAPLDAAELALGVLRLAERAVAMSNPHLASDLACAAEFAVAGLAASAHNVRTNHAYLREAELVAEQSARLSAFEREAEARLQAVRRDAAPNR